MTQASRVSTPAIPPAPSALTHAFERLGSHISCANGTEIYAQDDEVEMLYRLVRGVVRTSRLTPDGRRQVGDFYYPGEIFGLEPGPDHRFAAEALTDCEVVAVRRAAVRAYAGDAELDRAILEATSREMERLQDHVVMLGRKSARERVASFLMSIAQRQTEVQVARVFVDKCIELLMAGKLDTTTASMAKYWCSDLQCKVIDECLQLHGGYGYMWEYPIARAYADARVQRIYGGTNEIMKELITRSMGLGTK